MHSALANSEIMEEIDADKERFQEAAYAPRSSSHAAFKKNNNNNNKNNSRSSNYFDDFIATPTSMSINSFNFSINKSPNNSVLLSSTAANQTSNMEESALLLDEFRVLNEMNRKSATTLQASEAAAADGNTVLVDEVNRLRKYIYYLETENLRLNLKVDRCLMSGQSSQINNSNRNNNANPFEFDLRARKAVPESDSDEYKV